jgi:hypothetical protein
MPKVSSVLAEFFNLERCAECGRPFPENVIVWEYRGNLYCAHEKRHGRGNSEYSCAQLNVKKLLGGFRHQ